MDRCVRRISKIFTFGLILAGCVNPLIPVNRHKGFFPVSVWYAGGKARAPMLETVTPKKALYWEQDLKQIKSLGFNTVRCWVEWANCEKQEGNFDFTALETLAVLAEEVGLRLFIQVYIDSAPEWVGKKYPDGKFVASNGLAVESQASPGFCFDHPGVREKILRFFSEAAKVVKDKPALYGWDLWSEPHIINWAEVYHLGDPSYLQFCYCPHTMDRFREWLRKKYGSLSELNQAWYRTFKDWDEVEPPRFGTILSYTDYIDWQNFISDKLAEDLALKAEAVRSVVPNSVITSHSAIPGLLTRPNWNGTPDDRKMFDSVDYFGASIYPKHAWTVRPWPIYFRAAGHDFTRSMGIQNEGFYIGELQAGYGVFGLKVSQPVVAADLRDWMWTSIAYGARGVNIYAYYPMSSGYESGGYGLVELDGKITERARAAGRVARVVTENMDLFINSFPSDAQIAILYNPLAHMVGGQQQYTGEGQPIGYNNVSESLQGVHRAFFEKNIPVDFIHVMDLAPQRLQQYRLLIAPFPVMMAREHIAKLIDYVESGGVLLAEARCGWIDETGFSYDVYPGAGLHKIFGCRESQLNPLRETSPIKISTNHTCLPLLKTGDVMDALFFEESFELLKGESKILAEFQNGEPAAVYSEYGRGKAIIVGSFIGSAYHHFQNPNNARFLTGLADWLEVKKPVAVHVIDPESAFVEARILQGNNFKILVGFNRSEENADVEFFINGVPEGLQAVDLETELEVPSEFRENMIILKKNMQPREVWVALIKK